MLCSSWSCVLNWADKHSVEIVSASVLIVAFWIARVLAIKASTGKPGAVAHSGDASVHTNRFPRSPLICVLNYTIVVLTLVALNSDYLKGPTPRWVGALLYPFAMWTFFVIVPALIGVIIGIKEFRSKPAKGISAIAIAGNLALMVGYVLVVILIWPALMGV